jgi:hypothetical protein
MPRQIPARPLGLASASLLAALFSGCFSAKDATDSSATLDTSPYRSLFGENVMVFDDSMDQQSIQRTLDALHRQQAQDEFSSNRYALLFKPGTYDLNVTVDYYVQAVGLGRVPGDVTIKGAVQSTASTEGNKVTTMFWRAAENLHVVPEGDGPMLWAVSQAAPYRRMHVEGDVQFDKGSWASGGVLANSIVEGRAGLTTGQQWFTRNSRIGSWQGGNWNRVFVGVEGAPEANWPEQPVTVIDTTPVIREKPFLMLDDSGNYAVFVPELSHNTRGVSWEGGAEAGQLIPLSRFHIAQADKGDAASINAALAAGKHVLFTPGIYALRDTIRVTKPDTVLLGLGLPTVIPQTGKVAIETGDLAGIKIAGIMVDAGPQQSPTLFKIGEQGASANNADNPISLHDVFCRIGGAVDGRADACVTINSHHVVADHFWLWRADHGVGYEWQDNNSSHNGLIVNGDDVTIYGLFNEHFQGYQTLWNGERGRTYFYQSEIPYSPPSLEAWNDNGKAGFASYRVADHVKDHQAWGLGVYSFFRGEPTVSNKVRLENAIEVPAAPGVSLVHIATFAGLNGGINHMINGLGPATEVGQLNLYESYQNGAGRQ